MSLKQKIFSGFHEEQLFQHINSRWSDNFNVYPELPFSKIFDISSLRVNKKERDFLLKTNIDYTICDEQNRPLMSIEFDGWSHGYNRGSEYIQIKQDPLRKRKLELKLRIASEHNYPFYIIAHKEKGFISEKIHLTVIDGIIGQTVAKMKLQEKIEEQIEFRQDLLESLNEIERHEYIQDVVISTEVELELKWDPIANMAAEIEHILFEQNIPVATSFKPLSKPELPEIRDIFDLEELKKRFKAWEEIKWHGYEVTCETRKGKVTEKAWVRNFEGMWASPLIISKNIAELLALYRATTLNGIII
ncbi:hypothetical protein ES705_25951 [subsurface metagenome]